MDSPARGGRSTVALLTPRGWNRRPGDRWPTLYLFAGGDGDRTTWTSLFKVQDLAELRDVLVVMPGMPLFGFCTDWRNHGKAGSPRVRTYFLREVVPLMERDCGAGPNRAAAGESQGGFGALGLAARITGLFGAVATFGAPVHPVRHAEMWLSGAKFVGVDGYAIFGDRRSSGGPGSTGIPTITPGDYVTPPSTSSPATGHPARSTGTSPIPTSPAPRNGSHSPTTESSPSPKPYAARRRACSATVSPPWAHLLPPTSIQAGIAAPTATGNYATPCRC
ncbi:alpha/beta hydrolase-fold protein [Streptomyces microflavus]|uniref:alpha/beta hydrolase n=1 Tax=Streptomyces microflavus TaxID=1919 RepID=UPI003B21A421